MKYLSLCSGIEAASVAWGQYGFKPIGFSEIEPFPCSVLNHHYPDVHNFGDMTKFEEWNIEPGSVDVVVGGTPCQSFSIAGLRGGLDDGRGNLALTYCRILQKFKPRWFVWENVPGAISSYSDEEANSQESQDDASDETEDVWQSSDFATILSGFRECGYSVSGRILDAQYFGVPQRRRRIFVVGYLGDWRCPAEVLFESGCMRGNSKASIKKRKDVAGTLASRTSAGGGLGTDFDLDGGLVAGTLKSTHSNCGNHEHIVCASLTSRPYSDNAAEESKLIAYQCQGTNVGPMGTFRAGNGNETGGVPFVVGSLSCNTGPNGKDAGNFACNQSVDAGHIIAVSTSTGDKSHCLNAGGMGRQDYETETMVITPIDMRQASRGDKFIKNRSIGTSGGPPGIGVGNPGDPAPTIGGTHTPAIAVSNNIATDIIAFGNVSDGSSIRNADCVSPPLTCMHGDPNSVASPSIGVRRLTPIECERLQGFPDNYTNVMHRGKQAADGPRYKSLGNSMAVPVMAWIGKRMMEVENNRAEV